MTEGATKARRMPPRAPPGQEYTREELSLLLAEVARFVKLSFPPTEGRACRLSYEHQFRLRGVVEMIMANCSEIELLKTWVCLLRAACREMADAIYAAQERESEEQFSAAIAAFVEAVESLMLPAAPLDALYTTRTPHEHTRSICFTAFRARLDECAEQARAARLLARLWRQLRAWERDQLTDARAPERAMVERARHLADFIQYLDRVDPAEIETSADHLVGCIEEGFLRHTDPGRSPTSRILQARVASTRWLKEVYVGKAYSTMRPLLYAKLSEQLFSDPTTSAWLNHACCAESVAPIPVDTWFEWCALMDQEGWLALNSLAEDKAEYVDSVLSTIGRVVANSMRKLLQDADALPRGRRKQVISALIARYDLLVKHLATFKPEQSARSIKAALAQALKNTPQIAEAFAAHVTSLWIAATGVVDPSLISIFRALPNKTAVQGLLESALFKVILFHHVDTSTCRPLLHLLASECGENYVVNMEAALREVEEPGGTRTPPPDSFLAVRVVSSRLFNAHCRSEQRVVPKLTEPYLPKTWEVPKPLNDAFSSYVQQYTALHSHRILTFALEVSSAIVLDTRCSITHTFSAAQFSVIDLFNTCARLSLPELTRHFKGASEEAVAICESLWPLLARAGDGAYELSQVLDHSVDFREKWLARLAGTADDTGEDQTAVRESILLFNDVGLDALIMRIVKRQPQELRLVKTAVALYAAEHLGGYHVPDNVLKEHLAKLENRDFISIDQDIISRCSS